MAQVIGYRKSFGSCQIMLLRIEKEDERVCDYCGLVLVAPGGVVIRKSYLTEYGIMCSDCIKGMGVIHTYKPGEDVSGYRWYKGLL